MESEVVIKKELCNRCMQNGNGCIKYKERLEEKGILTYYCENYNRRESDRQENEECISYYESKWTKDFFES